MAFPMGLSLAYDVADAEHILQALGMHWAECHKLGVLEAEKKMFAAHIERARKERDKDPEEQGVGIKEVRIELQDAVGSYRTAASLVASGVNGPDPQLERKLRVGNKFPVTDVRMKAYLKGLDKVMHKHSGRLAARGFSHEQQARLVELGKVFLRMLRARGKERGDARATRTAREALFEMLRTQTSYFRRVGRAALRNSPARADFDRIQRDGKQQKKSEVPQQSAVVPVAKPA